MDRAKEITKRKIAYENITFLISNDIFVDGKRILDVGFGLGFNSKVMSGLNGDVYGVEPNKEAYDFAVNNNMISKDKAYNCILQELPEELIGTFDIVTLFLYNIAFSERQEVARMLSNVVKDDGVVIIGMRDDVFIYGDNKMSPVSELVKPYFKDLTCIRAEKTRIGNIFFVVATQPVKELEINRRTK